MPRAYAFKKYSFIAVVLLAFTFSIAHPQSDSGVAVWTTKPDRTSLLAEQRERLSLHAADSSPEVASGSIIEILDKARMQTMEGFGFALTDGSAQLLMQMSQARRSAILRELFSADSNAIGISYLRISIGASDMNEGIYTFDDRPPGETDPSLAHFSLGADEANLLPVLKEILTINPKIAILGSPWSAPSWMKTNDRPKDGSLRPEYYQAYAQYFVRYLRSMAAQGINLRAVTMQNEPENRNNTPSMMMTAEQEGDFLKTALGPALRRAGLNTEVILFDHNADHPNYPLAILADPEARQYAAGTGFHLYLGTIDAMTQGTDAYPNKKIYFTEQFVTQEDGSKPLNIAEPTARILIAAPRNWSQNVLLWNLAADPHDGPHTPDGGCPVCQGALTIDGDQVTRNLAYYVMAQTSKFVHPGSVRIESRASNEKSLPNVAYALPDGKTALIVANVSKLPENFSVLAGKRVFSATLDAGAVATYLW